jgi:hypothetical protein
MDKALRLARDFLVDRVCECGNYSHDHQPAVLKAAGHIGVAGLLTWDYVPCQRFRPVRFTVNRVTTANKKAR